jgi:hypothetical protein
MTPVKSIALALLVGMGLSLVHAQGVFPADLTLSWTNATQYEDGTLIEAGDLTHVRIQCTRNNETTPTINTSFPVTGEGLAQSETMIGAIPRPGTYECVGFSVIFDGTESRPSGTVTKKYTGKPNPPNAVSMD